MVMVGDVFVLHASFGDILGPFGRYVFFILMIFSLFQNVSALRTH